jgi:hypothetical protein
MKNPDNFMAIIFICLAVIVIRAKPPLWGGRTSPEMQKKLDKIDKILASIAGVCFAIAMVFLFSVI